MGPDTEFTEPVLAFGLAGRSADGAVIRVHLSLEAAPPWAPDDDQYAVEIRTDPQALLAAADRWERALASFPTR